MLGIEYFGNLEHYCFEKYDIWEFFSQTVSSSMTSFKFKGKLWNLANDVTTVYFWLSEFFISCVLFIWYILDPIFWNSLRNIHKIDYNLHVLSTISPTSRFPIHIALNTMFHCNTRHIDMIGMDLHLSLLFDVLIKYL